MLNAIDEVSVYIYMYIIFKINDRVHHGPLVEAEEAPFIQL